jgi:nucleotide-binding universal stress UspA family protein
VFVERSLADALERAERLGNEEPFARVVGEVDAARVAELAKRADPDAVVFAQREDEARWQRDVVF